VSAIRVKVRFVYDVDSKNNNLYPDTIYLSKLFSNNNADFKEQAKSAKYQNAIMHNKFFIFDDKKVLTGSANISATDLSGFNSNAIILMNSEHIANIYKKEFEERKIGNGYLNSDESDPDKVVIVLWDVVSINDYNNRRSTENYIERFNLVENIVEYVDTPHIQMVESRFCNTTQELIDHFVEARSKGLEGTVIKSPKLKWKDGKVKDGLKLKNEFECELKIIGFQEHSKKAGQIGAIFVESEDNLIKCKVGSGLTDAQRKKFFLTQDDMIGKIVTIKGNDLVTNEMKQDQYSIFLPRFVEVRDDKTVADTFDKIMATKDSIIDLLKNIE
jgi:hypothetical protein